MKDKKFYSIYGRNYFVQNIINLFPKELRLRFNPDRYCIEKFILQLSKNIPSENKLLDAGAGPGPYKKEFSHCKYEATDFIDNYNNLDFICNLENIPKKDEEYDVVLSTEVLEHVENPQKVLQEFFRILKVGGKLFMTIPQGWKLHQEPYNFFYFTKYGIESLLEKSGFKNIKIQKKGGYFWFLADAIRFNGILDQYKKYKFIYYPLKIIEIPINHVILPFILFHLDFLDKEKKWTKGYLIEATR